MLKKKQRKNKKLSVRLVCDNCNYCKDNIRSFHPERLADILRGAHCPNCGQVSLMQNKAVRFS